MEKLMLSKKQISDLWDEMEKTDPMQTEMSWDDRLQIALLNHLKGLRVVYIEVEKDCFRCKGEGYLSWLDEMGNHQGRTCECCKGGKKEKHLVPLLEYE